MAEHETSAMRRSPSRMGDRVESSGAGARIVLLVLTSFLVGLIAGGWWIHRAAKRDVAARPGQEAIDGLSDVTRTVLQSLDSPVEIRFYALLDPASVPATMPEFAMRVEQLLSEYQRASGGRIKVTRHKSLSDASAKAAAADGLKAFNRDKGEACYLGLAVACKGQIESLAQLAPEWEQALESDLTRAIVRVTKSRPSTAPSGASGQPDAETVAEVKRTIPNPANVSMEEGTRILREKTLAAFRATVQETEAMVTQAQQRLAQAQKDNSQTAQEAAAKELQRIQAAQTAKLKEIAARLEAEIAALEQLKRQ